MKSFSESSSRCAATAVRVILILAFAAGVVFAPATLRAQDIDALLEQMTLEEKVGQMTQLTIQAVSATRGEPGTEQEIDEDKLREAIVDRHVGSLLNVWDMAMTIEQWTALSGEIDRLTTEESRLSIPILYGIDAVHGNNYLMEATIFPQNIGMAATWSLDLAARAARITALESRAVGHTWNFAPVLDVGRNPLWSRFFETFGEDTYAASEFGRTVVAAMQEPGPTGYPAIAATGKHFLGYSMPLSGKDRTPAWIPERMLREYFVPPFRAAVDAGLKTIMVNSGEVNGIPVHADPVLLTDLLRGELGFDGVVVTDWEDIGKLVDMHHAAADYEDAVYQSVTAGIDMAMVPYDYRFTDALLELVRDGRIPESRIDESVRRILTVKKDLGLFDRSGAMPTARTDIGVRESMMTSLDAARRSITLLKNDGVLPLADDARILVGGPGADSVPMMFGSWSYMWQGTEAGAYPDGIKTFAESMSTAGLAAVTMLPDGVYEPDRVRAHGYGADVAVLAIGERPSVEKPGDVETLELPRDQVALVRDLAESGVSIVVVLYQNRPRIIRQIEPMVDAIVLAYQPGPYGGQAVTEVLTGAFNPTGHLPFTYPRFDGSLVPYDHKRSDEGDILHGWNAVQPQFPFGHGMSYTNFEYSNLTADASRFEEEGIVRVSVTITNAGDVAGGDAALLFVRDHVASVTPSARRLRAFETVDLEPGESTTVSWTLDRDAFSFIGRDLMSVLEPGAFSVYVENLETVIELP